jgi:hypothetical protein
MHTRFLVVLTCVFALGLSSLATTKKSAGKAAAGPFPDKAYCRKSGTDGARSTLPV